MQNQNLFNYTYTGSEPSDNNMIHKFDWSFDNYQIGNIGIELRPDGTIDESALINYRQNPREFSRLLGAYNDSSLYNVFGMMLDSQNISHK